MMRPSRTAIAVGGTAAIISVGYAVAPKSVSELALAQPQSAGASFGSGVYDGPEVRNARGLYQARITVTEGKVTNVEAVHAGSTLPQSLEINAFAIPMLVERVLAAQSWDVEAVSGASFTSPGFTESLKGAFDMAGLS